MKLKHLKVFVYLILGVIISCTNDKKQTKVPKQNVTIKSDILMEKSSIQKNEEHTLTLSGKDLLNATAILKITNQKGEEISCVSYPAKKLIHQEYSTANSALKNAHIKDVVENYFED